MVNIFGLTGFKDVSVLTWTNKLAGNQNEIFWFRRVSYRRGKNFYESRFWDYSIRTVEIAEVKKSSWFFELF